jgi:parvulin-like peptidyl-prolyl isomerase
VRKFALVLFVGLAGFGTSEVVYRSAACRDLIGRTFGRGHLIALAQGNAVYEIDLGREKAADDSSAEAASHRLVIDAALRALSRKEQVAPSKVARETDLVRSQFGNERAFLGRMQANGFSRQSLSAAATENLKARQWLEQRLVSQIAVTEEEGREFYRTHHDAFILPVRLRASHLFLAAPPETPFEVVEAKGQMIEALSQRIAQGGDFTDVVVEASEDETTRWRAGDLGFFASSRMLPEFFAAMQNLPVGELSKPVRSHLGFHLVRVTAVESARTISFEEARAEIIGILQNEQRRSRAGELMAEITREAKYFGVTR